MLTEDGPLRIDVPRDRDGSFDPVLVPKHDLMVQFTQSRERWQSYSCHIPFRQSCG